MPGVFLSYKKEDKNRVATIVEGLRAENVPVWWDQDIGPGHPWDETIKHHIEAASCIVAVWSSLSVTAPWVTRYEPVPSTTTAATSARKSTNGK